MFHSFQLKGSGIYIAGAGSLSEDRPVKMSGAAAERLRLKLQPGRGSSFKDVGAELAVIMKREPGTWGVYAGPYGEDKDAVDVLVCSSHTLSPLVSSLESHDAMAAVGEKLAPIQAAMGPHLAAPPQIQHIAFDLTALATLLEGEVVQMVTIEGVSVEAKGSELRTISTTLRNSSTCSGVEVGEEVGGTKGSRTIVVAAGWNGPVSSIDEALRSTEWWANETTKLGPGAKLEMHSVKFVKYF